MTVDIREIAFTRLLQTRGESDTVSKRWNGDSITGQCITKEGETRLESWAQLSAIQCHDLRVGLDHPTMLLWHSNDDCQTSGSALG